MEKIKKFLNKEEEKTIESIEIYLKLSGFELNEYDYLKSVFLEGGEMYRYKYRCQKEKLFTLIVEYIFICSDLEKIYLRQLCNSEVINSEKFNDIESFKDFLIKIL